MTMSLISAMDPDTKKGVKCIIKSGGKILLVIHSKGIQDWSLPGGKIERLESPDECVRREMKEELDLEIKSLKLFGETKSRINNDHLYCFECESDREQVKINEDEIIRTQWFLSDQLPRNLGPTTVEIFRIWNKYN